MEYSKEDLMEAKKQIWGVGENMGAICTGQRPLRHSPSGHHARSERPPNQMADLGLITTV